MALILGLESSCDETAAAVVRDGETVLSSVIASQIAAHAVHGGVVPELAAREHLKAFTPVTEAAMREAGVAFSDLDAIAITQGPGLIPALLVGLNFAKGLATGNGLPLIGVNHFMAHIYGAFLDGESHRLAEEKTYPLLALVVSGGHTSLVLVDSTGAARQLGSTIDDAAGEALDKGAKLLGLGYPGGPAIQKAAADGDPKAFDFPRPLTGGAGKAVPRELKYSFSFSGIKTALLYHSRRRRDAGEDFSGKWLADTVASYQMAVVDTLVRKTFLAARDFGAKTVVVAGGVACNKLLREEMANRIPRQVELRFAPPKYCTDNAAMVGGIGHHHFIRGEFSDIGIDSFARLPGVTRLPFVGEKQTKEN
ncbi:MAG: tRNA (adenosine(37)-N6)-threonylcarbamoyltransferase complex transferase subunit TsaD [Victivallaceae bacterium]|nr:tRNA (adenosine(37)-N6)-threonylcarbamoyltransferase complex transferase subunit TsaD [Victivallaceae bacterium]